MVNLAQITPLILAGMRFLQHWVDAIHLRAHRRSCVPLRYMLLRLVNEDSLEALLLMQVFFNLH